jgi:hypothetical protein
VRALLERAEALARSAQKRRVDQIAQEWRDRGLKVSATVPDVTIEGRNLARRRLSDLRFVGVGR